MTLPRLLDGSMNEVRRLHPVNLSLNEELHALSYASMTLPPGEEIEFHAWVEIFNLSGSAGIYRANKVDTDTATGCQVVKLEHGICALADAIANESANDVKGTVSQVLTRILGFQATQAGGADLWAIGTVEPTDDNVTVTINYNSTMALLTSLLDQLNECWPEYDQTQLPWTISIRTKGLTPTAEGRIGRNVESAKISYDDRDMANYIYCPKATGGYLSDATSIAAWGRREGYCRVDDGATAAQADDICSRYLAKRKDPAVAVSISMADLSGITGESLDRIKCGKLYRLALPKYGITVDQTVAAIAWTDLMHKPTEARVSLANHAADLVLNIKKLGKGGGGGRQQNEIDKAVKQFTTSIEQTDSYIRLIATETDVATAQTLGQSLFEITSNAIGMVVTSTVGPGGVTNTVNTASIILAINGGTGHSEVSIEADNILIGSHSGNSIYVGDVITFTGGNVQIEGDISMWDDVSTRVLTVGGSGAGQGADVQFIGGAFSCGSAASFENSVSFYETLYFSDGSSMYTLSKTDFAGLIKSAETISNGLVLRLNKFDGTHLDFSKATSLSGLWSGSSTLTITAAPQGNTYTVDVDGVPISEPSFPSYALTGNVRITTDDGTSTDTEDFPVCITLGGWSSGHRAVNIRYGSYDSPGFLMARDWVDSETPYCSQNVQSIGLNPGSRTYCGQISKAQVSALVVGNCFGFTISVNGLSEQFFFELTS